MSLEDGIAIPAKPQSSPHEYINSGAAWPINKDVQGTATKMASCHGAQTWTGTNTFNVASGSTLTATGFDAQGCIITPDCDSSMGFTAGGVGANVVITNINTKVLAGMGVGGDVVADYVYNGVWNDLADCIEVPESTDLEFGYCYCFDGENYYKSSKYLDDGIIGVHSDTAGLLLGDKGEKKTLHTASAGFVLAYVDKNYKPGTPLTCTEDGWLTEMKQEDLERYPHKLVGTFWKEEKEEWWGFDRATTPNLMVEVKDRKWIKVR